MSIKSKLGSLLIYISPTELKKRTKRAAILSISILLLILTSFLAAPLAHQRANAYPAETATPLVTGKQDRANLSPVPTQLASPTPTKQSSQENYPSISLQDPLNQGTVFLSLSEGGFSHLYVYQPVSYPLTTISSGPWDDITPAVSPDGTRLAFASNREGFWDIYILNLKDGQTTRFTNTPAYDAFPSMKPTSVISK
jgi:Tol biopolymer transport system component